MKDQTEELRPPAVPKPWQWPTMWFRDEKFWRDVAARAMSGLVLAFLLYLFAVFGGYIKPLNIAWVITVWIIGITLLFSFGLYYGDWTMSKKFHDKWRFRRYALLKPLSTLATGAVILGLVWFIAWLISLVWR